jgi:hypothetical protein
VVAWGIQSMSEDIQTMTCGHCSVRIEFPTEMKLTDAECPHCGGAVVLLPDPVAHHGAASANLVQSNSAKAKPQPQAAPTGGTAGQYLIHTNQQDSGPFSAGDLKKLLAQSLITNLTPARPVNTRGWTTVGDVLGVAPSPKKKVNTPPLPKRTKTNSTARYTASPGPQASGLTTSSSPSATPASPSAQAPAAGQNATTSVQKSDSAADAIGCLFWIAVLCVGGYFAYEHFWLPKPSDKEIKWAYDEACFQYARDRSPAWDLRTSEAEARRGGMRVTNSYRVKKNGERFFVYEFELGFGSYYRVSLVYRGNSWYRTIQRFNL